MTGGCLAADRPQANDTATQVLSAESTSSQQSILASDVSRDAFGIERWELVHRSDGASVMWLIEAHPLDARLAPTSLYVEIGGRGLAVAVRQGKDLRAIDQLIGKSGQIQTLLTGASGMMMDLATAPANHRANAQGDLEAMRSVIEVIAYVPELRKHLPEVVLSAPYALVGSQNPVLDKSRARNGIQYVGPECFVPQAMMAAIATAVYNNMGPNGTVACVAMCTTTAACIAGSGSTGGIIGTTPPCQGAAAGCATCGVIGLADVMNNCVRGLRIFFQER